MINKYIFIYLLLTTGLQIYVTLVKFSLAPKQRCTCLWWCHEKVTQGPEWRSVRLSDQASSAFGQVIVVCVYNVSSTTTHSSNPKHHGIGCHVTTSHSPLEKTLKRIMYFLKISQAVLLPLCQQENVLLLHQNYVRNIMPPVLLNMFYKTFGNFPGWLDIQNCLPLNIYWKMPDMRRI